MSPAFSKSWVPIEKINETLQLEPSIFLLLFAVTSFFIYKFFLGGISKDRHRNLRGLFRNLFIHCLSGIVLLGSYWILVGIPELDPHIARFIPYIGLGAVCEGAIIFIKVCRILTFEYLFFFNMQAGVPLLLVNLLTLILGLTVIGNILSSIFAFKLMPLLATSAIFSVVLGLALQETLGNLFSGVALQLDKPYAIGHWIEIRIGAEMIAGLVKEITWRATILEGLYGEVITIPNRIVSQSQISNYSLSRLPICRRQVLRVDPRADMANVRRVLLESIHGIAGVLKYPEPIILLGNLMDAYVEVKLVYYIEDYGKQWGIADRVLGAALERLKRENIDVSTNRRAIIRQAS